MKPQPLSTSTENRMESAETRFMCQPFHELGIVALKQLSQLLNVPSPNGADWRDIAGLCGFAVHEIYNIIHMDKHDGSNSMEFFQQLHSRPNCPTIGQLHTLLVKCQRMDAAAIIHRCFQDYSAVLQVENSQPLDLSTSVKSRNSDATLGAPRFEARPTLKAREIPHHPYISGGASNQLDKPIATAPPQHRPPMEHSLPISHESVPRHRMDHNGIFQPGVPLPPHHVRIPLSPTEKGHVPQETRVKGPLTPPHLDPRLPQPHMPHMPDQRLPLPPHLPPNHHQRPHMPPHPVDQRPPHMPSRPNEHDERMRERHFRSHDQRQLSRDHPGAAAHMPAVVLPHYNAIDTRMVAPPVQQQQQPIRALHAAPPTSEQQPMRTQEHGMDIDDAPPPLMRIEPHMINIQHPDSPPPPYEEEQVADDRTDAHLWRENSSVPSRCASTDSATVDRFTPDDAVLIQQQQQHQQQQQQQQRVAVQDPAHSSMDTDDSSSNLSDITHLKQRLDHIHMPDSPHSASSSAASSVKQSALDEKASKEKEHKRVLLKLRQSLIKDKSKGSKYQSGANMDCDENTHVNSQLPTVIESNWGEGGEGGIPESGAGVEADDELSTFLAKNKSATYPRCNKKTAPEPDMSNIKGSMSSAAKLDSVPFKTSPPVKVFLTYANGASKEEQSVILKDVRQLVTTFRTNNFDVSLDSLQPGDDNAKRQVYQHFKQAEFVLVCISPGYKSQVKSSELQRNPGQGPVNNAKFIYQHMQREFKKNGHKNSRFIPILIANSTYEHSPDWFVRICPRETFYKYPEQLRNLMYHVSKPDQLMKRWVEKQQLQRPFMSGDQFPRTASANAGPNTKPHQSM